MLKYKSINAHKCEKFAKELAKAGWQGINLMLKSTKGLNKIKYGKERVKARGRRQKFSFTWCWQLFITSFSITVCHAPCLHWSPSLQRYSMSHDPSNAYCLMSGIMEAVTYVVWDGILHGVIRVFLVWWVDGLMDWIMHIQAHTLAHHIQIYRHMKA